jgi:hypothetical protein
VAAVCHDWFLVLLAVPGPVAKREEGGNGVSDVAGPAPLAASRRAGPIKNGTNDVQEHRIF